MWRSCLKGLPVELTWCRRICPMRLALVPWVVSSFGGPAAAGGVARNRMAFCLGGERGGSPRSGANAVTCSEDPSCPVGLLEWCCGFHVPDGCRSWVANNTSEARTTR